MKKWSVLIILCMAMFIIVIDTTIMNVSISALAKDLNTNVSGIQAAIAIYALVMAGFMLIGGKLADIIGMKRIFLIGVAIFGIGTFLASIAESLAVLIIGWSIIEGLGSALMMPNIQTLLRGAYKDRERALSYGIISAVGAVGTAVGPIVGGFLTTYFSWRWAFRLEVIIVIAVLLLSGFLNKDLLRKKIPKFDYIGALVSISCWSSIVLGVLMGQKYGFWLPKQPFVIGSFELTPFGLSISPTMVGIGIILALLLFRWENRLEKKGGDGLFKPSLFKIPGLISGLVVRFTQLGVTAAFLFTYPLLLQLSFNYSAVETGVALAPFSIMLLIAAIVGAKLSARFSAKRIIQAGLLISIVSLLILAGTIKPGISPSDLSSGALFGVGIGLIASQLLNLILSSVEDKDTPEITGLNGTFEQLGNSIGVALVGTIMLVTLSSGLQQSVTKSKIIPANHKATVAENAEEGIELVSDIQLKQAIDEASVNDVTIDKNIGAEITDIYTTERTQAFKASIVFLAFIALLSLMFTTGLSDRKLVEV